MILLLAISFILVTVGIGFLVFSKRFIDTDKEVRILFLVLPILTVLAQYSGILFTLIKGGSVVEYLTNNPNLLFPIFPCNVVMWSLLFVGIFFNNREIRPVQILIDFCFFFGFFSAVIGMVANVDFLNNPTLTNYNGAKSIFSHALLITNIVALGMYKIVKIDLTPNYIHLVIGVLIMGLIGIINNTFCWIIKGEEYAIEINSMYMLRPSYSKISWLKYQIVVPIALILYFGVFVILDLIFYKKGNRFYNRGFHW